MFTLRSRSLVLRGAAVLTALFATLAALGTWGATPAEATSYRFWAYWLGSDNDWSFSSQGASRRPADGTVDGWRFAVSEASSSTTPPRPAPSFARICRSTEAVDGSKRVGLVVDFGTTADAPGGETPPAVISTCVVAPADANGYEVLDLAAVQLRTDSGLICGLNGYPATECGAVVADPNSSPSDDPSGDGDGGGGSGSSPGSTDSGGGSSGDGGENEPDGSGAAGPTAGDGGKGNDAAGSKPKRTDDQPKHDSQTDTGDPTTEETALAASAAAATVGTTGSGSPLGVVIGVGLVAVLLAIAYVLRRRRA